MLTANLWTAVGLVNGSMGTVQDIIFNDRGPPCLLTVAFISFNSYKGPTITASDSTEVVLIVQIWCTWEGKSGNVCSWLQLSICLAWAITVHKSQGLTLPKAKVDLGKKEFAAGLSFVAVSRVHALGDIFFRPFSFERLEQIKLCKRLQERREEERRLILMSKNRIT